MDEAGVVVAGAAGRMGRMLVVEVARMPGLRLVGALGRPGSAHLGEDAGVLAGIGAVGVRVEDDPLPSMARARAVIDFTSPEGTLALSEVAAQARAVHVIGTTGMSEAQVAALEPASRHSAQVRAGNTSLGVTLLEGLVRRVAAVLGDWDVEVVEAHHRHKLDAPSGTALMLGRAAAEGRGVALEDAMETERGGRRPDGAIGFASVRGGDVVGEHDVIFAGPGERVVLRHVATDRAIFARGAARAALWGLGRPPGRYDMADVLGL